MIQILIDNFLFYDFISMVSFCMTIINICNVFVKCNWYATAAKTKKKRAAGTACGFMGQPLCIGRSKCIINMVAATMLLLSICVCLTPWGIKNFPGRAIRTHNAAQWSFGSSCVCICPGGVACGSKAPPGACHTWFCVANRLPHDFPFASVCCIVHIFSVVEWEKHPPHAQFIAIPLATQDSLWPKLLALIFYDSCLQVIGEMDHPLPWMVFVDMKFLS